MGKHSKNAETQKKHSKIWLIPCIILLLAALVFGGVKLREKMKYEALCKKYPLRRVELASRCAEEFGLETQRVLAVMLCESSFEADAVSSVGAIGLMQVTPSTGEWLAGKLDLEFSEDILYDPETNARLGCWYLSWLDDRYEGDLTKATAAYHAGQGQVDKWLQNPEYAPDGTTLEVIPGEATAAYVARVKEAYEMYKTLYTNEQMEIAKTETKLAEAV